MTQHTYKVGELRSIIRESSQMEPVLGPKVKSENVKNNRESYKNTAKEVGAYDGGLDKQPKKGKLASPLDGENKTLLDFNPVTEPDERYSKRVKAQVEGRNNELETEVNDDASGVSTKGNKEIYKDMSDSAKDKAERRAAVASNGLTARMNDKKDYTKPTLTESPKPKRLVFKYTRFINENQMLSRIPEEYKKDGQVIHMVDKLGNEYIVECSLSSTGYMETNIKGYENRKLMNEQVARISELMDYKVGNNQKQDIRNTHINECRDFSDMMDIARKFNR